MKYNVDIDLKPRPVLQELIDLRAEQVIGLN